MFGNRMKTEVVAGCGAVIAMAGFFQADAAENELVLVEDGESLAPVVVFQDAPPKTRRAAEELVDYLEKKLFLYSGTTFDLRALSTFPKSHYFQELSDLRTKS